ncbi:MAG: RNA-binding protein, partial [Betaproteobacteria bacterium]|nr:RNA-binding protein [Betaproteobacteria bacterium]
RREGGGESGFRSPYGSGPRGGGGGNGGGGRREGGGGY